MKKVRLFILAAIAALVLTVGLPALPAVTPDGGQAGATMGAVYADDCDPVGQCG